jgi:hypothetical protein
VIFARLHDAWYATTIGGLEDAIESATTMRNRRAPRYETLEDRRLLAEICAGSRKEIGSTIIAGNANTDVTSPR